MEAALRTQSKTPSKNPFTEFLKKGAGGQSQTDDQRIENQAICCQYRFII